MSPKEAWKRAFLYGCAAQGLDLEQTHAAVKAALAGEKRAGVVGDLWGVGKQLGGLGLAAGVGGAAALGIGGGLLASKLRDPGGGGPEDIRRQELIEAYNFHADEARRRKALRALSLPAS